MARVPWRPKGVELRSETPKALSQGKNMKLRSLDHPRVSQRLGVCMDFRKIHEPTSADAAAGAEFGDEGGEQAWGASMCSYLTSPYLIQ